VVEALKFLQPMWWAQTTQPPTTPTFPSEPDEVDDEDEVGKPCHLCDEIIHPAEEAVRIMVVIGFRDGENVQCFDTFDDDGDFKYTPLLFHEECWGALLEDVTETTKDEPPIRKFNEATRCLICASGIDDGEEFSQAQPGELQVSPRCPNGQTEVDFFEYGQPKAVCFSCMAVVDQLVEGEEDEEEEDEQEGNAGW